MFRSFALTLLALLSLPLIAFGNIKANGATHLVRKRLLKDGNVQKGMHMAASNHSASGSPKSVKGGALQPCSQNGMAMTGFMRDGKCRDEQDDAGSHHICIQMKSDFCTVTGQPNWCEEDMDCMGKEGKCKIGNWCVCQWAFAGYLQKAGGCDSIVDLVCDATNMEAFNAYSKSSDPEHKAALACIKKKCNL